MLTHVQLPLQSNLATIKAKRSSPPFGDSLELTEIKAPWLQLEEGAAGAPCAPDSSPGTQSWRKALPGEEPEHRSVLQSGDRGLQLRSTVYSLLPKAQLHHLPY